MKIDEIISSAYPSMLGECYNDNVIAQGKTANDLLNDIILQTLKHFKHKDIKWEEGYDYMTDNWHLELYFAKRRKDELVLFDDCAGKIKMIDKEEGDV